MTVLVILLFGVNLVYCVQLNGLISPPASDAVYSTDYGVGGGNGEITSGIKLAEAASNANGVALSEARGLPITHNIRDFAPSISTSGNVGIISGSVASPGINHHGISSVKQFTERVPIPVPQPYPVTITRPAPESYPVGFPHPVSLPVPHSIPVPISRPIPIPITRPIPGPFQRPFYVNAPQPVQLPIPQAYPIAFQHPTPFRIPVPITIPIPIPPGITGHGGIIAGGNPGIFGGIGQYIGGPFGGGHVGGLILGGADGGAIVSGGVGAGGGFIAGGGFSNVGAENYGGHSVSQPNYGISQNYDSKGGYKY